MAAGKNERASAKETVGFLRRLLGGWRKGGAAQGDCAGGVVQPAAPKPLGVLGGANPTSVVRVSTTLRGAVRPGATGSTGGSGEAAGGLGASWAGIKPKTLGAPPVEFDPAQKIRIPSTMARKLGQPTAPKPMAGDRAKGEAAQGAGSTSSGSWSGLDPLPPGQVRAQVDAKGGVKMSSTKLRKLSRPAPPPIAGSSSKSAPEPKSTGAKPQATRVRDVPIV